MRKSALQIHEEEGEDEGRRAMLERILRHRFGDLPPAVEAWLRAGSMYDLQAWAGEALGAATLDDVPLPTKSRSGAGAAGLWRDPPAPRNFFGFSDSEVEQFRREAPEQYDYIRAQERFRRDQGRVEGSRAALQLMLACRFEDADHSSGQKASAYLAFGSRLAAKMAEQLETWADRMLDADTIDDVFRPAG